MVLTRRKAAALLGEQQLKPREPEKRNTEEEEGRGSCTNHEQVGTHLDHTPLAKEDNESGIEEEQVDQDSLKILTAAACSILKKARVDERNEHVESSDEETDEDCMETEEQPCSYMSLSGVNLAEEKSVKKRRIKKDLTQLSSRLQPDLPKTSYLTFDKFDFIRETLQGNATKETFPRRKVDELLLRKTVLTADVENEDTVPVKMSKYKKQKLKKAARERTAGEAWFNLPATPITPELHNDLKVLRMRGAIDPQRHYRKADSKELPKFFQVGRVVGGPLDFYSGRIPKKQRRSTIVGELMADLKFRKFQKRKFQELQERFSSGTQRYRKMKKRGRYRNK